MIIETGELSRYVRHFVDTKTDDEGYVTFLRFTPGQMDYYSRQSFFKLMSQCSSGVCFSFETDGNELILDCKTVDLNREVLNQIKGEMSFAEMLQKLGETVKKVNQAKSRLDIIQHFDLYVDDHFLDSVRIGSGEITFSLDNPDRKRVHVTLWLPLYKPLSIRRMTIDGSIWDDVRKRPGLYVFGDSITQGFVAGKPSFCYVTQLAELLGFDALNQGVGSMMHDASSLCGMEDQPRPDRVMVAYGTNDWHMRDSLHEIKEAVAEFYERLVQLYPDVPIYTLTPIWREDMHEQKQSGTFSDVVGAIRRVVSAYDAVSVIDGLDMAPHNPACYSDGWLHPNIVGFSYMASRIYREILKREQKGFFQD